MENFKFIYTKIDGLYVIESKIFQDKRGYFLEYYNKKEFYNNGLTMNFVQDNQSKSTQNVLRGLHFQTKNPQGKLVRVIKGTVYDVAVDLRIGSPTFGQYEMVLLSEENKRQLYIPVGFAHGFLVKSKEAIFTYKCSDFYNPEHESGIIWNDKNINIDWPIDNVDNLIISEKDKNLKTLYEVDIPFKYEG